MYIVQHATNACDNDNDLTCTQLQELNLGKFPKYKFH